MLIRNLVDYAIRYSPDNATVKVPVSRRPTGAQLIIEDRSTGMRERDLPRLGGLAVEVNFPG